MSQPTDAEILQTMERYGGSFVQQLAKLAHTADLVNFLRIKAAFNKEFAEYAEYAELAARREKAQQ